jgi:hypothetical protein
MFAARSAASVGIGAVAIAMGLLTAKPTEAQTLGMRLSPTTLSFPDANPTTTPVIQGNQVIAVRVRVRNALPSDSWSVHAQAAGELQSLTLFDRIPIANTAWTVTQGGGACNCTCQAGTNSSAVPQLMLTGQGNTGAGVGGGNDVRCFQRYTLSNSWTYNPGSYSQIVTITLTAP